MSQRTRAFLNELADLMKEYDVEIELMDDRDEAGLCFDFSSYYDKDKNLIPYEKVELKGWNFMDFEIKNKAKGDSDV